MDLPRRPIQEWRNVDLRTFREEIVPRYEPAVLKGLVAHWPAVIEGARSPASAHEYLAGFDRGVVVDSFVGSADIKGRFFYSPDMSGFNFAKKKGRFGDVLRFLLRLTEEKEPPSVYIGSVPTREVLPGFAEQNPMELLEEKNRDPRIWIGNRTEVSAHFDVSDNIACIVAGQRRFTLFPPDQVKNLYVGPLDTTMAGQPASMVALNHPDFEKYPRFHEALAASRVAELGPGDAIYIPELWWHDVEALSPFNVLVNYWWRDLPPDAGSPFECLAHGILTVSELRPPLREAWRAMFDHYVFRTGGDPVPHIAPEHRGILGTPTPELRARFKNFLLRVISRY